LSLLSAPTSPSKKLQGRVVCSAAAIFLIKIGLQTDKTFGQIEPDVDSSFLSIGLLEKRIASGFGRRSQKRERVSRPQTAKVKNLDLIEVIQGE
jgi:hypothetical protein